MCSGVKMVEVQVPAPWYNSAQGNHFRIMEMRERTGQGVVKQQHDHKMKCMMTLGNILWSQIGSGCSIFSQLVRLVPLSKNVCF